MEAYTGFAGVYDTFMDEVPYDEWCEYIVQILKDNGIGDGIILDLGCGTGSMTRRLFRKGFDMIGVDLSEDMLNIARETDLEEEIPFGNILYLNQDMREFELYGTVAAIISICDSMNYITDYEDLVTVLKLANNYLDPKGVFVFDMNTPFKYKNILGESSICESREDAAFIWENFYDEKTHINEYSVTVFEETENGLYERYDEVHYQRAYSIEEVRKAVEEAGMKLLAVYGEGTFKKPVEDCERMYFVVQECGK